MLLNYKQIVIEQCVLSFDNKGHRFVKNTSSGLKVPRNNIESVPEEVYSWPFEDYQ